MSSWDLRRQSCLTHQFVSLHRGTPIRTAAHFTRREDEEYRCQTHLFIVIVRLMATAMLDTPIASLHRGTSIRAAAHFTRLEDEMEIRNSKKASKDTPASNRRHTSPVSGHSGLVFSLYSDGDEFRQVGRAEAIQPVPQPLEHRRVPRSANLRSTTNDLAVTADAAVPGNP